MHDLIRSTGALPGLPGRSPAPYDASADQPLDLRRLVAILWRGRWHVLAVTAMVVLPVAVWVFTAEKLYRSAALLELNPDPVQVLPYRELDRPSVSTHFEMFLKGQYELLRGPTVRARVRDRLKADVDRSLVNESDRLEPALAVQRLENTYIFRVAYVASDPQVAAQVANAFAEEYIKYHFATRQQTRENAQQLLQRELDTLERRVQQSESGLVAYAQRHQLSVEDRHENPARAELDEIVLQHTKANDDVHAAQARLAGLERYSAADFPESLTTSSISDLNSRLLQMELDLSSLQATFGANWPTVVAKRKEIVVTTEQLAREKRVALAQAVEQARLELSVADGKRTVVAETLLTQQALVKQIENATIKFNIIKREVETNQKLYDGMLERLRQTSISSGMEFGGILIVERATPSVVVDSPKAWWNLGLATLLGLALGASLVLVRDYWDTSLSTVDELSRQSSLPVLGIVPTFQPARPSGLIGGLRDRNVIDSASALERTRRFDQTSASAEAMRDICTSILLSRPDSPPRVLMITSAVSRDGKTTVARELAYAFSERGARTVLVECDLRRPCLATSYGIVDNTGLSAWLAGVTSTPPVVHELDDGPCVVVAGPPPPNPVVLLYSDRLRTYIRELAESFRFVIIDAPPGLGIADARVLAPLTDGVVIVARAGKSQGALLRAVQTAMESTGVRVLGSILNGTDPSVASAYVAANYRA